jgi:Glycosyltransferase
MEKKRLLLIVPNLRLGGQQRVAINTAVILESQYNITLAVFTMDGVAYDITCQAIDLRIPAESGYLRKIYNVFRRTKALKQLKRDLKIDVAISLGNTANLPNVLSKVSDKIILSVHGYASLTGSYISKTIDRLVYRSADTVVCVAEKMAKDLVALYDVPEYKVVTLYNPYDFARITDQAQAPISLEIRHPAIAAMGRLEKVKGYRHLMRAFDLVQQEIPEATLVFIGEGKEREELERMAVDLGLAPQVAFVGFQSNPYSYLAKCDLLALSSINEGFPNAMVEAMACALPVVASDCKSGPREIVNEVYHDKVASEVEYADYGILIPPFATDDSDEPELDRLFANAILRLLKDNKMFKRYKERSQERARVFSFNAYKNKIMKIIEG